MLGPFPQQAFHDVLIRLATTPGPSLQEEPRRLVLKEFFDEAGVPHDLDTAGNLWVSLGPGGWREAVVYDAHIDVVERGYTDEVTVSDDGERLIGLGVGDNLAAVTMMAFAAKTLWAQQRSLKRPLKLLFSVGEEGIGNLKGIRQIVSDHPAPPYLFIAFDLSFETYSIAALGSKRYRVKINCPGGHSWDDFGSPNAIEQLLDVMGLLKHAYAEVTAHSKEVLTFNIGTIQGGQGINTIARFAEVAFEFRSTSPDLLLKIDQRLSEILPQIQARKDVSLVHTLIGDRPAAQPFQPERIEPLVRRLLTEQGENIVSKPRSTNINIPLSMGWPSMCMGLCQCRNYHREDESLDINSLPQGWELLNKLTQELVG